MRKSKIIISIILLILIIFIILFVRKFLILESLEDKLKQYLSQDNYFIHIYDYQGIGINKLEYYRKGNNSILNVNYENNATVKIYKNNETSKKYLIVNDGVYVEPQLIPIESKDYLIDYFKDLTFWEKCKNALLTPLKLETYNGKQVYRLDGKLFKSILDTFEAKDFFVDKDTGLVVHINSEYYNPSKNQYDEDENIYEFYDFYYTFNKVTDKDIADLDLSGYTILENP